jgi:hypothetical protein
MIESRRYPTAEEIHAIEEAARRLRAETIARGMQMAARAVRAFTVRVVRGLLFKGTRRATRDSRLAY